MVAKVGSRYLNEGPKASITLTTGSTADKPAVGWSVFSSYAAGLHGMARALAVELAPVRVNVVSPGPVKTELWEGFGEELKTAIFEEMEKKLLTRHVALPEEIAESYLWLMKDSSVTGTVVRSDSATFRKLRAQVPKLWIGHELVLSQVDLEGKLSTKPPS
ncbi:hypothetical protein SS1G_03220 [Sclerotinia sclerotiorum 1980 UF-70]|uniref:Ketoreductase (KR) domain-containing protein n=1 Tax=Sclerotinia sclerotiorum (strain ATCC 18683 / 1980 / Ss-1) TaxID=665079 RepID=A7ED31_SCLS1|nr:hypothetical protein SS1G_03220 [Sclerotinia sclerotiorum 1980 UF-70]EDO00747.1 hypothetical protein SS1G_03220 [Sclerotinia sclerotiorum 1980 UF-70]